MPSTDSCIQWNPSTADNIRKQHFVPNTEVSLTPAGAFGLFPVGIVSIIRLLSTAWLCFQSFLLLYVGREVKLLTATAMVDNLVETVDECPQNRGHQYCLHIIRTTKTVHYTEYSRVPAVEGCPLSGFHGTLIANCKLCMCQHHNFCIPDWKFPTMMNFHNLARK